MTRDKSNTIPVKSTPTHGSDRSWPNTVVCQARDIGYLTQGWQYVANRISAYPLFGEPWDAEKKEIYNYTANASLASNLLTQLAAKLIDL